jgi:dTDP-glucose 4,6-dehydratase
MTKRLLLTGASGFVASHILEYVLENTDWDVVCLSSFVHHGIQDRIVLASEKSDKTFKRVKVITCDLSSPISEITSKKIGNIDYVINAASESHVDRSIKSPGPFIINNVSLMCNILDWARRSNLEKFIHVSTDEVYGPAKDIPSAEWDLHLPSNPYSASKAAQEDIAFAYWKTYNVPIVITNSMNIIGERQDVEKYTPLVISKVLNNEKLEVHTYASGKIGSRQWLYAGNMASAVLHILAQEFSTPENALKPDKWNISGDAEYDNLEWATKIANIMNKPLNYRLSDPTVLRPGYDYSYNISSKKLLDSGWIRPFKLESSLEKTVDWYLSNKEWLENN